MNKIIELLKEELAKSRQSLQDCKKELERLKKFKKEEDPRTPSADLQHKIDYIRNETYRLRGVVDSLEWVVEGEIKRMYNDLNTKNYDTKL